MQVLNVALGGTLHQDLPTDRPTGLAHNQAKADPPVARTQPSHDVAVLAGSRLAGIIGDGPLAVNSMHHQGLRRLAPSLHPVAHAPDGLVEGVEAAEPAGPFLLGVQWHPEELARAGDAPSRRLFAAAVTAAAKRPGR
jgi:putative glutamine amidotransferase